MKDSLYAVIMAGGSGTRLWPVSHTDKPKQFHMWVSDNTLLVDTYERVKFLVRQGNIFVSTTAAYYDIVRAQLPEVPIENIIVEPCARDTLPAISFVAQEIHMRDPEAIIITAPSDHAIKYPNDFVKAVFTAFNVVEADDRCIGLLGITPTKPSTALGYIRRGNEIQGFQEPAFHVDRFQEKPNYKTAQKLVRNGEHYWNGGYFIFKTQTMLDLVQEYALDVWNVLQRLKKTKNPESRAEIFGSLEKHPIDTAILEKIDSEQRFCVPGNFGWTDLGLWNSLWEFCKKDENNNVCRGSVIETKTADSIIFNNDEAVNIVTYGVQNLVIVVDRGIVAIFHRRKSDHVKTALRAFNSGQGEDNVATVQTENSDIHNDGEMRVVTYGVNGYAIVVKKNTVAIIKR